MTEMRTGSILGNAVRRVEDPDLVVGAGDYVDDLRIDAGPPDVDARGEPLRLEDVAGDGSR